MRQHSRAKASRRRRVQDRVGEGGRAGVGALLPSRCPQRPEVGKACRVQGQKEPCGQEGGAGGGDVQGEGGTHTCAAPGSCSGRPGAGPGGSGSSADRPAWLSWGRCALDGGVPARGGRCVTHSHTLLHARSSRLPQRESCPQPPCPEHQTLTADRSSSADRQGEAQQEGRGQVS